jgi:hypothetical protein
MPSTKKAAKQRYDVHPSLAMVQKMMSGLKEKTGRSLAEWVTVVEKDGPATEKERREWLKTKHGLGLNYASWIAEFSVGKGYDGNEETYLKQADEYVEEMYAAPKSLCVRFMKSCCRWDASKVKT